MNWEITYSLKEIEEVVPKVWELIKESPVVALKGGLGAGKTTFTKSLCKYLGSSDTVNSPTFSIINEYGFKDNSGSRRKIFHSDWYRLKDEEEAFEAGVEEILEDPNAICIVEWPEQALGLLPERYIEIQFEVISEDVRRLVITKK